MLYGYVFHVYGCFWLHGFRKKRVNNWFPEASTNHRAKNTGVNRNLQMGGESRWKPPSFSAMNGPDVNLCWMSGFLWCCAKWGRPSRASSQTFSRTYPKKHPWSLTASLPLKNCRLGYPNLSYWVWTITFQGELFKLPGKLHLVVFLTSTSPSTAFHFWISKNKG